MLVEVAVAVERSLGIDVSIPSESTRLNFCGVQDTFARVHRIEAYKGKFPKNTTSTAA